MNINDWDLFYEHRLIKDIEKENLYKFREIISYYDGLITAEKLAGNERIKMNICNVNEWEIAIFNDGFKTNIYKELSDACLNIKLLTKLKITRNIVHWKDNHFNDFVENKNIINSLNDKVLFKLKELNLLENLEYNNLKLIHKMDYTGWNYYFNLEISLTSIDYLNLEQIRDIEQNRANEIVKVVYTIINNLLHQI